MIVILAINLIVVFKNGLPPSTQLSKVVKNKMKICVHIVWSNLTAPGSVKGKNVLSAYDNNCNNSSICFNTINYSNANVVVLKILDRYHKLANWKTVKQMLLNC